VSCVGACRCPNLARPCLLPHRRIGNRAGYRHPAGRYASIVPDHTLKGLLTDLTKTLTELTASEARWVGQLRQVRPKKPCQQGAPIAPPSYVESSAPTRVPASVNPTQSVGGEDWPTQTQAAEPHRPPILDEPGGVAHPIKRDYDYFADLDVKLAELRRRAVGSRGN
jgi:hypothetical protein